MTDDHHPDPRSEPLVDPMQSPLNRLLLITISHMGAAAFHDRGRAFLREVGADLLVDPDVRRRALNHEQNQLAYEGAELRLDARIRARRKWWGPW